MRLTNKIGCFIVSFTYFEDLAPGEGVGLFDRMVVLRAHENFVTGHVEYYAIHPDFRPKAQGEMVPRYMAQFNAGSVTPQWVEEK